MVGSALCGARDSSRAADRVDFAALHAVSRSDALSEKMKRARAGAMRDAGAGWDVFPAVSAAGAEVRVTGGCPCWMYSRSSGVMSGCSAGVR